MKTLLSAVAGTLALAVVTPASAADMPLPDKVPPPAPGYWTAFYIGVNGGGAWGQTDYSGTLGGVPFAGSAYNSTGYFAGGQFGINYQFPSNVVLGFNADIEGSNINGTSTAACIVHVGCQTGHYELWSFSTLEGRLGYAFGNLLVYGTGGGVAGNTRSHSTLNGTPYTAGDTAEPMGWEAGAGIEWGFLQNWTVKLEYQRLQFINDAQQQYDYGPPGATPVVGQTSQTAGFNVVRIGVNYLFHWNTPAVTARY